MHTIPRTSSTPLPVLEHAWQDITVDSKALPISEGKDTMLVVVDKLTKYSHFIALSHPFTTSNAELFFINIVRHGLPRTIVSDQDKIFLSNFWQCLFKTMGIHLR